MMMSIDKIQRSYVEGSKDIGYSLDLTEYRKLNVPSVKVSTTVNRPSGLQSRQTPVRPEAARHIPL